MADDKARYNDKVKLTDGGQGVIKYVGEVIGKEGVFYGVDLVKGTGKNNGTVKGQTYFKTKGGKKSGKFCRKSAFKKITKTEHSVDFTVGDAVKVKSKGNGIVRFVGMPSFSKVAKPMYGVELDEPKGICDGTFKKITYFTCPRNHGVYTAANTVSAGKSTQSGKKKKKKDADDQKEEKPKKKKKDEGKKKGGKKKKTPKKVEAEPAEEEPAQEEPPEEEPAEEEPKEEEPAQDEPAEEEPAEEEPAEEEPAQEEPAEEEPAQEEPAEEEPAEEEPAQEEPQEEEAPAEEPKEEEAPAEEENKEEENKEEDLDKIGDITEDIVVEYLKEHFKPSASNIISPHDIAKQMLESQGVPEAQFQFHLNQLGKVTYWIVNSANTAFGDCEVPGEGFKLAKA